MPARLRSARYSPHSYLLVFREQEAVHLFWSDVNAKLNTIRVTLKPEFGFSPKRWEEREVPVPKALIEILAAHPRRENCRFVFPSPAGNREWHMLDRCKEIAKRAGLDEKKWDLKRSGQHMRRECCAADSMCARSNIGWGIDHSKRP
jgi:integrase